MRSRVRVRLASLRIRYSVFGPPPFVSGFQNSLLVCH